MATLLATSRAELDHVVGDFDCCRIMLDDVIDQTTEMGPLVSKEQQDRVLQYIESGRKQGASVAAGGGTLGS